MMNSPLPRVNNKPFILTRRDEEILKAVAFYRYMTTADITRLLGFAYPGSLKYVGKILATLSGGKDYQEKAYLYRFLKPHIGPGNTERIYTLGALGRSYLQELGMDIDWYFRPQKIRELTYSHILHPLALTRFLIAAQLLPRTHPDIHLQHMKIEYELRKEALEVMTALPHKKADRQEEEVPILVVPDAWLDFSFSRPGNPRFPVLVEIDRATEQQQKFKQQIASRLAYIRRGGAYSRQFGTEYVTIAYATTGSRERMQTMLTWAQEVMQDLHKQSFSPIFHFVSLPEGELDPQWLFLSPVWYTPQGAQPVTLLS